MSLLRRKRRQNRMAQQAIPATRNARSFLDFSSQGLRFEYNENRGVRLSAQRERKTPRTIIELPDNPYRLDFARDVRQAKAIHEYNKVRQSQVKYATKPLFTIKPNQSIRVDLPPEHPICIRREERRMMMFATGKAGKGGQHPRRDNNNLTIRCEK